MGKNKDIYKKDEFSEQDYKEFERRLFSSSTSVSELQRICMTLAHTPTKKAQDLLKLFTESDRAHEVGWLALAAEEQEFHYLSPENEQEERDYLALKVLQELQDELVQLDIQLNEAKVDLDKMEIRYEAVRELVKKGELEEVDEAGVHDAMVVFKARCEELAEEIEFKDKIFDQVKESIKTEKYKDVDPMSMRNVHWG
ncbi:MAG: hypothetical protein GTO45_14185 [Candidatus Aminicenantes bacterium]|nr:hypothetical protein [Candidatus Aminicenantes bacterium]NIM79915.1 hypothetical protein [Candidatus Aminicenantes bacterium]NIN19254.1 hypothetical protein [Candidatus Aminicenantes bacterium]NIN43157.1 hypothetical protein [Candidatus Aminicenantes bacterium]NIN85896.1 hypothetical protein [Candidatus Aminicenantes bacterium]